MLLLVESESIAVTAHRRQADGGFVEEYQSGTDVVIPQPEIDAELPLAELYEGAGIEG